jgi:hypothetical protein
MTPQPLCITSGNSRCTQTATGGGTATGGPQNMGRDAGMTLIGGVIDVAVKDVLNNVEANLNALNGANVSVVCLNDARIVGRRPHIGPDGGVDPFDLDLPHIVAAGGGTHHHSEPPVRMAG